MGLSAAVAVAIVAYSMLTEGMEMATEEEKAHQADIPSSSASTES